MGPILGGSPVVNARIVLHGQSNCEGIAAISEIAALTDTGLAAFRDGTFNRVYIFNATSGNYEKLKLGTNQNANSTSAFGAEFGLAVRWMRETTRGCLFIDKRWRDGQPIASFQEGTAGNFMPLCRSDRSAGNTWLAANGFTLVREAGWIWVQGESDAAQTQAYYHDQLVTLDNAMTASSPVIVPGSAKRVIVQMVSGSTYYSATVAAAKTQYASEVGNARLITMISSLNGDNTHLNAKGQIQHAYDAFEKIFGKPHLTAA